MRILGRAGMVCYGVVHVLVAYLAVRVAFGDRSEQADETGAIQEIGATGIGGFLLWVLAVGLVAFGLWQLLLAATGFKWLRDNGKRFRRRAGAAGRGVVGIALGVVAVTYATGSGSSGGGEQQQTLTAKLLALPAGPVIVGLVALVIIGVAVAIGMRGARKTFLDELDTTELPSGSRRWVIRLGVLGYLAKGVTLGIIGVLIGIAAFQHDPEEAGGVDAALKTLAGQPFGTAALVVVGLGLAAYGVYCFAAAKAHRD